MPVTEHECIKKIVHLGNLIKETAEHEQQKRRSFRDEGVAVLQTFIKLRYDYLLRLEVADATFSVHKYKNDSEFLEKVMISFHDIHPLKPDFVKWCMSKMLGAQLGRVVNERAGNLVQASILQLSKLLCDEDHRTLVIDLIEQLHGVLKGSDRISFLPHVDSEHEFYLNVPISPLNGSDVTVFKSILYLFIHGSFNFEILSAYHLLKFWLVLLKIYNIQNIELRTLCVLIFQKLVGADLGNWVICRILMDKLLQVEKNISENLSTYSTSLQEAHHSFFLVFADKLKKFEDANLLKNIDIESLILWGKTSVELSNCYPSPPPRITKLAVVFCHILSKLNNKEICRNENFKEMIRDIQKLISTILSFDDSQVMIDHLVPYMTLLLRVDSLTETKLYSNWICGITMKKTSTLTREEKPVESILIRRVVMASLSRCRTPLATEILPKILPDQNSLVQMLDRACDNGSSDIVRSLLEMIGDVITENVFPPALTVAFLSVPWLTDPELVLASKRHFLSINLLKDFVRTAKKGQQILTDQIRECSLRPLAHIKGFSEWRRIIFLSALQSKKRNLVLMALSNIATFIAVSESSSFNILVSATLDLFFSPNTSVELSRILSALSACVCASHPAATVPFNSIDCKHCLSLRLGKGDGFQWDSKNALKLPERLLLFLENILKFKNISTYDRHTRLEAAILLSCCMCHSAGIEFFPMNVLENSLNLMAEVDEEIQMEYYFPLKLIISSKVSESLLGSVRSHILAYEKIEEEEQTLLVANHMCHFLVICAKEAYHQDIRSLAFQHHFSMVLQFGTRELFASMRVLIRDLASASKIDSVQLFERKVQVLSEEISNDLVSSVQRVQLEGAVDLKQSAIAVIDDVLVTAQKIFAFESIELLIASCGKFLIPAFFLVDEPLQNVSRVILDRIRHHIHVTEAELGTEFFPSLLSFRLLKKIDDDNRSLLFVRHYCGIETSMLVNQRRYFCNLFLIHMLSVDQEKCLELIFDINMDIVPAPLNLTKVISVNCEYLGLLLHFRRTLFDDVFYELRHILLASFAAFIRLLESSFISQIVNKLMVVLRAATTVGEGSIPSWIAFVQRLETRELESLLPQILIAIQPLMRYEAANDLLELIFEQKGPLEVDQCENFKRTALVLINRDSAGSSIVEKYLRRVSVTDARDRVVKGCVRMLIDECETVGKVVLEKLITTLDGTSLDDVLAAELVPALFHCLRRCSEANVRLLAARCLGRIGAVDPGRLGLSLTNRRLTSDALVFAGDKDFSADLIERCWRVYSTVNNAFMIDQIEYSIQELLAKLVGQGDEEGIMNKLHPDCRRDIEPLRHTHLNPTRETKLLEELPIVDNVTGFDEWLQQCYLLGAAHVRGSPMREVFRALKWIVNTKTTIFTKHILCQLIIRLLVENPVDNIIDNYSMEMEKVLQTLMTDTAPSWIRMAAHVVFSILDVVERYIILKINGSRRTVHREVERARAFVNRIVQVTMPDGSLLVVAAAERCQCLFRALRWCEQYGIGKDDNGGDIFCRNNFYTMERLYSKLQNVDGVLGAFECLANRVDPSADERILALEANGDYSEAFSLYESTAENQKMKLIRCLLRLKQPSLALDAATSICSTNDLDEATRAQLEACQMEATWHLRDWERLEKMIDKSANILSLPEVSWGATCASIMCSVKKRQPAVISARLESARERLVENLTAMTIEHADAYAQAYKYVVQLHILEEVDDATTTLKLLSSQEREDVSLQTIISKWKSRSESTMQCTSTLEPILQVRREILESSRGEEYKKEVAQLLIESSRLARQAGHLQIAWTHLVEAKKLNVSYKDVGMEEARFEFQKGNQQQAIGLLSKLLKGKFENMNKLFGVFVNEIVSGVPVTNHAILQRRREERAAFAEVQLLRAEYIMKAGAMGASDLYKTYNALRSLDVPSEDLFYRVAVFMDGMFGTNGKGKTDLMILLLDTYCSTLKYGKSHLFHALPRMLTLWLDMTEKKNESMRARSANNLNNPDMEASDRCDIDRMNTFIIDAFRQLSSSDFYTAFPQLVSRIVHPVECVFNTLKIILSELICKYPHQCLWQSIAVYRTGAWSKNIRQQRCTEVYNVARNKSKRNKSGRSEMEDLIDQYDYISALLIKFADDKCQPGTYVDMSTRFAALYNFFKLGKLDCSYLMGAKERRVEGIRKVTPSIMIPLTEMLQHAVTPERDLKICYMSQMVMLPDSLNEDDTSVPELLVHSLDQEYIVLKSMQRPKKLTLRAADGRTLPLMCKPGDELRKDARFMDVSRMMNSLMKQNADARRRQLMVRTFSVIPLQSGGGILEWINNLMPYRAILQPLFEEKSGESINEASWFKNWDAHAQEEDRIRVMRTFFYKHYPLVMADWFRRQFADPASWHAARTSYASSSAVMSMIGFILGLGDRHGENVLMDVLEGCVVHVDFNLIFNKGEQLPVKECVPFRLTRNMVNGLGPTGVEGVFRKACEVTLKVLRENKETLLSVIQTFVHDPLVEWITTEARTQQNRRGNVREQQQPPKAILQAQGAVSLIEKRLGGHIVTPELYKLHYNCAPMSLEGQVDKLISLASDESLLAQMYIGWAPFM
ncbi:unnamed protein product [Auanema sp. JU1783]|nr:unnamed protein product [Auanema sp. JU1783]